MSDQNSNEEVVGHSSPGVSPPPADVETGGFTQHSTSSLPPSEQSFSPSSEVAQPASLLSDDAVTLEKSFDDTEIVVQSKASGRDEETLAKLGKQDIQPELEQQRVAVLPEQSETSVPFQSSAFTPSLSGPQPELSLDDEQLVQPESSAHTEMAVSTEPGSRNTKTSVQHIETDSRPQWEVQKERFMKMPLDKKREQYACGKNYIAYNEYNFPKPNHIERPNLNKVCVWRGDITTLEFDAIVNAANERMRGGGGVDGAIHKAAGLSLLQESIDLYKDGCKTGEAKITGGYKLPAKYIIHTVGPRDRSEAKLRSCYESVLRLVEDYDLQTVAFPCIATGVFGYPNEAAANVALTTVLNWLGAHPQFTGRIVFCVFLPQDENIYHQLIQKRLPSQSSELLCEQPLTDGGSTEHLLDPNQRKKETTAKEVLGGRSGDRESAPEPENSEQGLCCRMCKCWNLLTDCFGGSV
ncbi:ADP-ribose glycohydrolase MACROD2-like isoform X2 [Watersipora subatra]|uniref:ADP-ribose glycohydrolase MACROD2-like isoform X2 n=1 Tax=Watersipora subatra TaxID=2589382 RepID=UPI00355B298F